MSGAQPARWWHRFRWLWPALPEWRRYRVMSRANPATLHRKLRLAIRDQLRRSGVDPRPISRGSPS
ncbi:MAG: hypothetical protein DVB31_10210 [Verrucomicrobia bacterium]|nr:MAG: hypothetical protein DVB31_10210 [Verrucomicrobiota bacterium]